MITEKEKVTEAVILCINSYDYKSELKLNDLVVHDDEFYNIVKIDDKYKVNENETNEYKYFVESKVNGELMNFKRSELSKATLGYFDSTEYFENNRKLLICTVPLQNPAFKDDINYIKAKFANDWEMGASEFKDIQTSHLHELTINGTIKQHTQEYIEGSGSMPSFNTFRVDIKR